MDVTRDIATTRSRLDEARRAGGRIALVPTMGALHVGHLSLVEAALRDGAYVVVSIFVNPIQFGPNEDFERYPRDEAGDFAKCEQAGVELVFTPPVEQMYPPDAVTSVHVSRLTETLCGPCRPGHFDGVTTVVCKLFNIVQPPVAYFGQTDAQQLAVIRRMARGRDRPVGLGVSGRNQYLSADERRQATALYRALCMARERIQRGARDAAEITLAMRARIDDAGPARVDYISAVDPDSMQPVRQVTGPVLLALAVHIGRTRLIDNILVDPSAP